jgi:anti-anti-sigma factor
VAGDHQRSVTTGLHLHESGLAEVGLPLQVSIRESGDVTILNLRGKATIGPDSEFLSNQINDLITHGACCLLLNLTDLTQVDSSGLSAIVTAHNSLQRQGGSLKFLRPNGRVLATLKVIHLLDTIPSFEDEAQALASFGPRSCSATS